MNRLPIRGREPGLKAIAQRIGLLGQGRGGCLLIEGPPGIGKTRMVAELAELARSRNLPVASAACDELDRHVPMLPLLSALRAGSDPVLAPGELDSVATGADGRFWFLERLRNILEYHARRAPFVIILDDLHWADAATLAALRFLCPHLASSPVLWVFAHDPGQSSAGLDRVLDQLLVSGAGRLSLTPLDPDSALRLATDLLLREVPSDVRQLLEAGAILGRSFTPDDKAGEHLVLACRHLACGQLADAAREAGTGQRIAGELGLARPASAAFGILGQVAFHQGDLAAAEDYARSAEMAACGLRPAPAARWVRVLLADADGRPGDALDLAFEADAGVGQDRPAMLLEISPIAIPYAARIALRAGRADGSRDLAAHTRRLAAANPEMAIAAGVTAHADGIAHRDPDALSRAVAAYQETGYDLAAVMASEDLGRALLTGRDHAAAVVHLRRALTTAAEIGAMRHADRIRRVLRQAGVRHRFSSPRRPVTFGWGSLTDAELRVASLAAEGLTNQAIADRLFLSPHTVNTHLRHIFSKLGINSRLGLIRFMLTEMPSAVAS